MTIPFLISEMLPQYFPQCLCPGIQGCLCLPSTGTAGLYHHALLSSCMYFLLLPVKAIWEFPNSTLQRSLFSSEELFTLKDDSTPTLIWTCSFLWDEIGLLCPSRWPENLGQSPGPTPERTHTNFPKLASGRHTRAKCSTTQPTNKCNF